MDDQTILNLMQLVLKLQARMIVQEARSEVLANHLAALLVSMGIPAKSGLTVPEALEAAIRQSIELRLATISDHSPPLASMLKRYIETGKLDA